jgi:hypothetical protein
MKTYLLKVRISSPLVLFHMSSINRLESLRASYLESKNILFKGLPGSGKFTLIENPAPNRKPTHRLFYPGDS